MPANTLVHPVYRNQKTKCAMLSYTRYTYMRLLTINHLLKLTNIINGKSWFW